MTCRELELWILSSPAGATFPPEAEAHIAGCETCKRLVVALSPATIEPPLSQQLDKIEARTRANLAAVKPLARTRVLVLWFLLIALTVVAAGIAHFGTAGWEFLGTARRIFIFSLVTASFFLLAAMLARQMAPGSRIILRPSLTVIGIVAVFIATVAILFQVHPEQSFVRTGLTCLSIGIGCAFTVALISCLVLRRGLVLNPIPAGALTGLLAGTASLALLETFCPNPNEYHVLAWHLGAVVVSTVSGLGFGWVVDRLRT